MQPKKKIYSPRKRYVAQEKNIQPKKKYVAQEKKLTKKKQPKKKMQPNKNVNLEKYWPKNQVAVRKGPKKQYVAKENTAQDKNIA